MAPIRSAPDPAWQADLRRRARMNIAAGIAEGVLEGGNQMSRIVTEVHRVLSEGAAPVELSRAHERLAREGQKSILRSYDQTVTRNKKGGTYRRQDRYAGGKLRSALASPEMIAWDERGFSLINVEHLDREAAHWARLNAGALPAGRGSRRAFQVRFSGFVVAALSIDMTPSPAFFIPRGYWWEPGFGPRDPSGERRGRDEFYPVGSGPRARNNPGTNEGYRNRGKRRYQSTLAAPDGGRVSYQRRRPTAGIRARNFLDAGAATVARELGPTYERLYRDLWNKKVVTIRPRPFTQSTRTFRGGY